MSASQSGPALEYVIRELMPHLVIVDFDLSCLEALETALQICQRYPAPELLLSAKTGRPDAVATLVVQRTEYAMELVDLRSLPTLVESILAQGGGGTR